MGPGVQAQESTAMSQPQRATVPAGSASDPPASFLDAIVRHKNLVLSSPFILAAALMLWYALGGSEIRKVLDFLAPGHLF